MNVIFIITDKDLGWEQKNFEIKKTRIGARGILHLMIL